MKVSITKIEQAVVDEVLQEMRTAASFTAGNVTQWFVDAGVPMKDAGNGKLFGYSDVAPRAADRLIQKERMGARISFDGKIWKQAKVSGSFPAP